MAHIVMAYIVMADIVVAMRPSTYSYGPYIFMAYTVMAHIVMAHIVMAYIVMADIVMAARPSPCPSAHDCMHAHARVDTFADTSAHAPAIAPDIYFYFFKYRGARTRAVGMPSAMPRWSRCRAARTRWHRGRCARDER